MSKRLLTRILEKKNTNPSTKKLLKIDEPKISEKATSYTPLIFEDRLIAISGAEVPKATKVKPTIMEFKEYLDAKDKLEPTI